jgi:hypothetical protein
MRLTRPSITATRPALLGFVVTAATVALVTATGVSAAPPVNGCPEGFELISVAQGESEGYPLARLQDEFVGRPPGNHDGYVCRRPVGDGIFHDYPGRPDTVYLWLDNSLNRYGR